MQPTHFSGAYMYEPTAFQMTYPSYPYGYPWVGSLSPSYCPWEYDSTHESYTSGYSGTEHDGYYTARAPWDMNSLKDALHEARTGTGEVSDVITSCEFCPREAAFTKLICVCGRWKDSKKAIEVFQTMTEKSGVRPNTITYTALISACSSAGDSVAAIEVFKNMKFASMTDPECYPNEVTYNKIIPASECGGFYKFCVGLFEEMRHHGFDGDRAAYCSALHSYIKLGSWDKAETILSIMHEKGYASSLANYTKMIYHYGETGRMENALNLFIELQKLTQKIDQRCCHALMRAFELAENDDMAMDLLESMWEAEISVEMPTYVSALSVFALKGNWKHSLATLKQMAVSVNWIPEEAKELILKAAKASNKNIIVKKLEEVFNNDTVDGASASSSSD
eukprot:g4360.t1